MSAGTITQVRTIPVIDLCEGDRIMLKDLRVLTVLTDPTVVNGGYVIKFRNLAAKDVGQITVPLDQRVKIL